MHRFALIKGSVAPTAIANTPASASSTTEPDTRESDKPATSPTRPTTRSSKRITVCS